MAEWLYDKWVRQDDTSVHPYIDKTDIFQPYSTTKVQAHQWHFTQKTPSISSDDTLLLFSQNPVLSFKTLTPLFSIKRVVVITKI
jgi:hypothetical protein